MTAGELTEREGGILRHALGLPNGRRQSYRVYYVAAPGTPSNELCLKLCQSRHMKYQKSTSSVISWTFTVTRAGAEAVLKDGETLDPEDFPGMVE